MLHDQDYVAFQGSEYCRWLSFACSTHLKIDRYLLEIKYLFNLFATTYRKFLVDIDHIDFHPSNLATFANNAHSKCSTWFYLTGGYHATIQRLLPSEELFLERLLAAILEINPLLHQRLSCMKCFSVMTWLLGWGVYSNSRSIKKIKKNL